MGHYVLSLSDGRQYKFTIDNGFGSLEEYSLNDIKITSYWIDCTLDDLTYLFSVLYLDGTKEYYNTLGELVKKTDKYNNEINYTYSGSGLSQIKDSLNRTINISYSQQSVTITAPDNTITTLNKSQQMHLRQTPPFNVPAFFNQVTYNRLDSITDPINNTTQFAYTVQDGPYTCDEDWTAINNSSLLLTSVTHPTGATTQYAYTGYQEKLGENGGYFTAFKVTSRKDQINNADYNIYTFSYNGHYSEENTYKTIVYKPSNLIIRYTFDEDHLNTLEERFYNSITTANRKETITKTYNSDKLLSGSRARIYTSTSVYRELYESYVYNSYGNIIRYTDANGHITTFTYYTSTSYAAYCLSIPTGKSYNQDVNTIIRENYILSADKRDILSKEVYRNNILQEKTDYTYDSYGNVVSEKRYLDNMVDYVETTYSYTDSLGRTAFNGAYLNKVTVSGIKDADNTLVAGTPGEAAGTISSRIEYDVMGRPTKSVDGRGAQTLYQYDALGNVTRITNPDGSYTTYSRNYTANTLTVTDPRGTAIKHVYNKLGLETSVVDVATNTTLQAFTYDDAQRKQSETVYSGNAGRLRKTVYTYDWADRVTSVSIYSNAAATNLVYQETYAYDDTADNRQNLKTTKTVLGGTDNPSVVTTTYTDKVGNTVKTGFVKDGVEYISTYTYDYTGNVLTYLSAGDAAKNLTQTAAYEYDYAGRTTKEYNALGQNVTHT